MSVILFDPYAVCTSNHAVYVIQFNIFLLGAMLGMAAWMCINAFEKAVEDHAITRLYRLTGDAPDTPPMQDTPVDATPVDATSVHATPIITTWHSYNNDWSQIPVGTEIRHTHKKRTLTGVYNGGDQARAIRKFAKEHIDTLKSSGVMRSNSKVTPKIFSEIEFKGADGEWRGLHTIRTAQVAPPEMQEQLPQHEEHVQTLMPTQQLGEILFQRLQASQGPKYAKELTDEINANPPAPGLFTTVKQVNGRLYSMLIREMVVRDGSTGVPRWTARV